MTDEPAAPNGSGTKPESGGGWLQRFVRRQLAHPYIKDVFSNAIPEGKQCAGHKKGIKRRRTKLGNQWNRQIPEEAQTNYNAHHEKKITKSFEPDSNTAFRRQQPERKEGERAEQ
jgi:hypothetical protein